MNFDPIRSHSPVLLVGGGDCPADMLLPLLARTKTRVAADGGAAALLSADVTPDAVIGDLDSLTEEHRARIPAASWVASGRTHENFRLPGSEGSPEGKRPLS